MKNLKFDQEEQEILKAFQRDELTEINSEEEIKKLKEAAVSTVLKNKNINIRISSRDLLKLKAKALERGLPYQTLVSSLIHQYTDGKIAGEL